jgi:hypothetical protein
MAVRTSVPILLAARFPRSGGTAPPAPPGAGRPMRVVQRVPAAKIATPFLVRPRCERHGQAASEARA